MEKVHSSLAFLLLCLTGISFIEALGFSVELIHRDSSKSPFYNPNETHFQRVANAIRHSINQVNRFKQPSTENVKSDVIPNQGPYLMSYSVGTPPFKTLGIVDTGSDIVWLQCKPCELCYNQTTSPFDPSKSKTYKILPCNSSTCQSVTDIPCSSDDQQSCQYNYDKYRNSSRSQVDLILDTLTLDSSSGVPVPFPETVIGCGHGNTLPYDTKGSGIVGLGNGPASLITQLGSSIQGKFSYCLEPIFSQSNSSSKLNFGDDAVVSGDGTVSTPMAPDSVFYNLNLEGVSVGINKIEFESSSSRGNKEGNIIINSGTTLTLLPNDFYHRLEALVAGEVKYERTEDPTEYLSLCYKVTLGQKLEVPEITVYFSGADVQLNALNTFVHVTDDVACFAFAPSDEGSVFGNLAQQNFLIGYDLQNKVVSFKPTDCTKQ